MARSDAAWLVNQKVERLLQNTAYLEELLLQELHDHQQMDECTRQRHNLAMKVEEAFASRGYRVTYLPLGISERELHPFEWSKKLS